MGTSNTISLNRLLPATFAVVYGAYLLGVLFPESAWGVNFVAFLSPLARFLVLGLPVALYVFFKSSLFESFTLKWPSDSKRHLYFWGVGLLFGFLFNLLPIHTDFYGDGFKFYELFDTTSEGLSQERWDALLSLDLLNPKNGEMTVLNLIEHLSSVTGAKMSVVTLWIDLICGVLFTIAWLYFIHASFKDNWKRWIASIVVLSSPFIQNFAGHLEIYAPTLLLTSLFGIAISMYIQRNEKKWLYLGILFFLVGLKFHAFTWLLAPVFIVLLASKLLSKRKDWIRWNRLGLFLLVLFAGAGAILYFVILKDHVDPRVITSYLDTEERVFLPLFSPEAPLDRYNLFSWGHIRDMINLPFIWSSSAIFLLLTVVVGFRKSINWNRPEVLIFGMLSILMFGFFFLVNPLVSMPMDWDLFSLPAPIFLFFVLALFKDIELPVIDLKKLTSFTLVIGLISASFLLVNARSSSLSQRYEAIALGSYENYWQRSGDNLDNAIEMESDSTILLQRYEYIYEQMKPFADINKGVEREFSHICWRLGYTHRKYFQNWSEAEKYHLEGQTYYPNYSSNLNGLVETSFYQKKYDDMLKYALLNVQTSSSIDLDKMRAVVHASLRAKSFDVSREYCDSIAFYMPDEPYVEALSSFSELKSCQPILADLFFRGDIQPAVDSVESYFTTRNYRDAKEVALALTFLNQPSYEQSRAILVHCSLAEGDYALAKTASDAIVKSGFDNPVFPIVSERIENNDRVEELVNLFSPPEENNKE